jgi:hypothetical protein
MHWNVLHRPVDLAAFIRDFALSGMHRIVSSDVEDFNRWRIVSRQARETQLRLGGSTKNQQELEHGYIAVYIGARIAYKFGDRLEWQSQEEGEIAWHPRNPAKVRSD